MEKLRYYRFVIKWLWRNRTWRNTRQKWKALDREWERYERSRHA